ncbi:MAG: hypothetical protein KGN16_01390 [Burkholderiales bacterium]|nr:hypothetical protein [Burkholderiales bacterium]
MLDGLKRLFSGTAATPAVEWEGIAPWAQSHQYAYKSVQDEGFVIDGRLGEQAWRLEWGPSQRPYIQGQELRVRAELGLSSELQLVLMNRELQEAMEKAVFEQYVEGVQTRIDNQTPPEMRWLVMFPKLAGAEMPALREQYVALSSAKTWLLRWLDGPLTPAIAAAPRPSAEPMVLMIGRGRLMLRTALAEADIRSIQGWLRLFECAVREAQRVATEGQDAVGGPTTTASLWSPSALPGDERQT